MPKKKPYLKPECKKLFMEPEIKKHGKMNEFIGTQLEHPDGACDCDCVADCDCGGACPYVFVWNGIEYVKENNILPLSEVLNRKEKIVEDYYMIRTEPQEEQGYIRLKISEFEHEFSWFKNFELISVEHPESHKIGFTHEGKLLSYRDPLIPLSCKDKDGKDVLGLVTNDNWFNPERFYMGYPGDTLDLNWGRSEVENLKLVIVDPRKAYAGGEDCNLKMSIHIHIFINSTWQHIDVIHSREEFYADIVDLTPYLPQIKDNLKMRLEFTANHRISFIGIDTSMPTTLKTTTHSLIHALHTESGDVTDILKGPKEFVTLSPGQSIELSFPAPLAPKPGNKLSYALYSKGYYIPLTKIASLVKNETVAV